MSVGFYLAFTACLVKVYKKSAYFKHTCMCALMYLVHMFFKVWQLFLKLNKWYSLAVTTDINREVKDAEFRQQINTLLQENFPHSEHTNSLHSSGKKISQVEEVWKELSLPLGKRDIWRFWFWQSERERTQPCTQDFWELRYVHNQEFKSQIPDYAEVVRLSEK